MAPKRERHQLNLKALFTEGKVEKVEPFVNRGPGRPKKVVSTLDVSEFEKDVLLDEVREQLPNLPDSTRLMPSTKRLGMGRRMSEKQLAEMGLSRFLERAA